jgi:hypothetical protein
MASANRSKVLRKAAGTHTLKQTHTYLPPLTAAGELFTSLGDQIQTNFDISVSLFDWT